MADEGGHVRDRDKLFGFLRTPRPQTPAAGVAEPQGGASAQESTAPKLVDSNNPTSGADPNMRSQDPQLRLQSLFLPPKLLRPRNLSLQL